MRRMCLLHILHFQSKTKRRGFYHSINECLRNACAWCRISSCQKADIFESLDSALVGMALQMHETSLLNQTYKMTLFQLNCLKTLILQLVQVSCLMLINHLKCLWQQSQELLRISISREISNIPNCNKTTEISLNQFECCSIFHFQIHKRKQV